MADDARTKEELLEELAALRRRVAELETSAETAGGITTVDVAGRKRAEDARRESEQRYRLMAEHASDVIWTMGMDLRFTFVSPSVFQLRGYTAEEAMAQSLGETLVPESLSETMALFARQMQLAQSGDDGAWAPIVFEVEQPCKDGTTVFTRNHGKIIRGPDGQPSLVVGVTQDITERKRAEAALRESESRYQNLSDATFEAIFLSEKGICTDQNRVAERMFGYTQQEAIGQPGTRWIAPEDRDTVRLHMMEGYSSPYEVLALRKDGSTFPCEIQARVMEGSHVRTTALRDITDRKLAEEERRKLEAQVQQSQKLESLGVLAGGIAHDFNNLLTGLLGNADLALSDLPSHSPVRPLLHAVQQAGRRAAELTRQMLAYSGKGQFVVEDVDISSLVQDTASLLASSTSKKATLSYELSADLPGVRADATQLRQIVLNLVINASDAVGNQGGSVRIRTATVDADRAFLDADSSTAELAERRYVTIEVSDTGCGMDDETKVKVFDPFFTTKFTGRGLGLAAVQGIVRGHQGAIQVDSELGRGTTFTVLLPALDHSALPATTQPEQESNLCGSGTILVVDDEEMVRELAARMLTRQGFSVLAASDGVEAVDMFREHQDEIACVLLDLKMPRMDGEQAYEAIREIDNRVRVILSSGYSEQESTERFGGKGLAGFLNKPYEQEDLMAKLSEVLDDGYLGHKSETN